MRKLAWVMAGGALLLGLSSLNAAAQNHTSYVSMTGSDSNACTYLSPCRWLVTAIGKTNSGGSIYFLNSGYYGGNVAIAKSLAIVAPEGVAAFVEADGLNAFFINGSGIKVTLRGIQVMPNATHGSTGNAITIAGAAEVSVEKVVVVGTGDDAADAAIRVSASGTRVFVTDTTLRPKMGYGIYITGANANVLVNRSHIERTGNNGIRGYAAGGSLHVNESVIARPMGYGVWVYTPSAGTWDVTVTGTTIHSASSRGVFAGSGTAGTYRLTIADSVLNGNGTGLMLSPAAGETASATVGNSRILGSSSTGIYCGGSGSGTLVVERNEVSGNYRGISHADSCIVKTLGNNVVENNTTDVIGVLRPATLR